MFPVVGNIHEQSVCQGHYICNFCSVQRLGLWTNQDSWLQTAETDSVNSSRKRVYWKDVTQTCSEAEPRAQILGRKKVQGRATSLGHMAGRVSLETVFNVMTFPPKQKGSSIVGANEGQSPCNYSKTTAVHKEMVQDYLILHMIQKKKIYSLTCF